MFRNNINTAAHTDHRNRTARAAVLFGVLAVAIGVVAAPGVAGNHGSPAATDVSQGQLGPESVDETGTDGSGSATASDDEGSDHIEDDRGFEGDGDISAYALLVVIGIAIAVDLRLSRV
jgi:hypothetical protein